MRGLSATDVLAIAEATRRLGVSPAGLAGRLAGLGAGEQKLVPPWGWYGAAAVLGIGVGVAVVRWAAPRLS